MNFYPISFLLSLLCISLPAYADSEPSSNSARVTIGGGIANTARYLGSNERRYRLIPTFNAQWQNGWFAGFPRGVGYNFSSDPHAEYGLRLTADHGRKQNVSTALGGLGDIAMRAELGGFYNLALSREIKFNTGLRYGAGQDRHGAVLDLGMNYRIALTEDRFLTLGIKTSYANNHYMQSYFGVTAAQSARSGYAVSTPKAGISEVGLSANYLYKIDRNWSVLTGISYAQLGSIVQAAPMSRSHSASSLNLLTSYTF